MELSHPDRALLRELQSDAGRPLSEIGARVGMAQSTVSRKMAEFEAAGLIKGRVVLLDPAMAGVKLCVFASVSLEDHSEDSVRDFAAVVAAHREILECHAVSGTADYILKIRVADVEAYEAFMTHVLLRNRHVRSVVSSFSLREIKYATALPL